MSFTQVQEFNDKFEVKTRVTRSAPEDLNANVRVREAAMRYRLIKEEFKEALDSFEDVDIVELVDALGDIKYVAIGAAQVFGVTHQVSSEFKSIAHDYEGNLFDESVQKEVLQLLRLSILRNDPQSVAATLAVILKLVEDAAVFFRVDDVLEDIVTAIHKSNMTKLAEDGSVIRRESDGKVLKGPNYKEPTADIETLLGFEDVESE